MLCICKMVCLNVKDLINCLHICGKINLINLISLLNFHSFLKIQNAVLVTVYFDNYLSQFPDVNELI